MADRVWTHETLLAAAEPAAPVAVAVLPSRDDPLPKYDKILTPEFLDTLEKTALSLASEFQRLNGRLTGGLAEVVELSDQHVKVHLRSSETLSEQINQSVNSLFALITKCKNLNTEFAAVRELHKQIQECRKLAQELAVLVDTVTKLKK